MCKFFSFCSNGDGRYYYFNWHQRQELLKSNPMNYKHDSHTSIADAYKFKGAQEDKLNKYEYNPLTKLFTVDQINGPDDRIRAERWVRRLDFKKVVEPLIIKPLINPFQLIPPLKRDGSVRATDLKLLDEWIKVWNSVRTTVWKLVWNSVENSVGDSVGNSVRNSVGATVWNSVGDLVGDSVWDSVRAYYSSFFDIKYNYDFSSAIKLWERGFIPSFDGKIWRLHAGKNARIVHKRKA